MIELENVSKTFVLHNQGGVEIPVLRDVCLAVAPGDCVVPTGASGSGKSTLMRMIYGKCMARSGRITVGDAGPAGAEPRKIIRTRRELPGYVSQFLRVAPRVPALDVVAEPLPSTGSGEEAARARSTSLLERLNIPQTLWNLSPTTFSGGEQQRVNIARGFVRNFPTILLDKPTASPDVANRDVVPHVIKEAKARGAAIVGIFHDDTARRQVCDREIDVTSFNPGAAA
ncbi:phosphonate C-P lyase system protein PhnL [uncultured Roseobacter sp.]|uniref:phosphonate C-P lyase system protein PhnL n=1 Tax=uncultured Roseobacter sp. TaxID=114847 RepID=UPI002608A6EA|nr:phosphonate C-P lyase system protein PhnL [uncultured Roseobacter sp.]